MDFDEIVELVTLGGTAVLVVAVLAALVYGFFSSNELYSAISAVVLGAIGVVAGLALIGYIVREVFWG